MGFRFFGKHFVSLFTFAACAVSMRSIAAPPRAASTALGVNVFDFGATPNDLFDDTKAIQAAIDSLPRANPLDVTAVTGGVVEIPRGVYRVTSLKLYSNVTLRGEGAGSVLIGEGTGPTIVITAGSNQLVSGASLDSLSIISAKNSAIAADVNAKCIVASLFQRLAIKAHRTAIDLQTTYSQNASIRNVVVWNGGGAALFINGNANEIDRLNTERADDPDFTLGDGTQARVNVVGQGNTISGCIVESGTKSAPAFYCRGSITWTNNWVETFAQPSDVAYIFEQCSGQIDNLHLLEASHRAKFINSQSLQIRQLDMSAEENAPDACLIADDDSSISVDQAVTRYDCGWLDHANVRIASVYNKLGKYLLENRAFSGASTLVSNPEMKTVDPVQRSDGTAIGWRAWEDSGKAVYTVSPETIDGDHSLRIDVKSMGDKSICIAAKLNVPASDVGKKGILQVRMDGPSPMLVWSANFAGQYSIRHWGERVMAMSPTPLTKDEEVFFVIDAKGAAGTYRISNLSVRVP